MPTKHQLAYGIEEKESGKIMNVWLTRTHARLSLKDYMNGAPGQFKITVVELRKTKKKA